MDAIEVDDDVSIDDISPSRRWDEPVVLVALVAIVVGAVWTALLSAPTSPATDSSEAGFARDMMSHHSQAVEIAEIVRDRTRDPIIDILATDIALTQQAQIGQFQGWLAAWGLPISSPDPSMTWMGHPTKGLMPGLSTDREIAGLRDLAPAKMDAAFLQMMIPHHRAALAMARAVLDLTDRPEVVAAARKTLDAQGAEIQQMQELLVARGYERVGATPMAQMPPVDHDLEQGVAGDIVRWAPAGIALAALAWLVIDSMKRRAIWAGIAAPPVAVPLSWRTIAIVGLTLSGLIHIGLTPQHFQESPGGGIFFAASGSVQLIVGAWLLAWPQRVAAATGVAATSILIVIYVLSRTTGLPGTDSLEPFDALGIITKILEIAALAACLTLLKLASGGAGAHDSTSPV